MWPVTAESDSPGESRHLEAHAADLPQLRMSEAGEQEPSEAGQGNCSGAAQCPGDADGGTACPFRLRGLPVQCNQRRGRGFARHFPALLDQKAGAPVLAPWLMRASPAFLDA